MPFVPSFKSTSSTTSIMLSFFLCTSGTVDDDDDTFTHSYIPYSMRMESRPSQLQIPKLPEPSPKKKPKTTRSKKGSKMVIGSPTNFRHDVHLGSEVKTDLAYEFWDSERWRQELMKKNLFLPPIVESNDTMDLLSPPPRSNESKRNSITPQKRKPVPSLLPPFPSATLEPYRVPLPPSPTATTEESQTFEDARSHQTVSSSPEATFSEFSLPTTLVPSEPPSRGPSLDDDHGLLPEMMMVGKHE